MQVLRSGYYAWAKKRKSTRQEENERLVPIVRKAHEKSGGTYGPEESRRKLNHTVAPVAGLKPLH